MRCRSRCRRALGAALLATAALLFVAVQPADAAIPPSCKFTASTDPFSDLGKHSLTFALDCDKVPSGEAGYDWRGRRVRITANHSIRHFLGRELLFSSQCSVSDTVVDCLAGGSYLADGWSPTGVIQFKRPVACGGDGGLSLRAQYTLLDSNDPPGEHTFQAPVRGPCVGDISIKGVPKKCTSRDFKAKVGVPAALRALLVDNTYGRGNESDALLLADLLKRRRGKSPKRLKTLTSHVLRDFSVKVPARGLRAGKYALRVGLETDSPDDYPSKTASFTRC